MLLKMREEKRRVEDRREEESRREEDKESIREGTRGEKERKKRGHKHMYIDRHINKEIFRDIPANLPD